MYKYEFILLNSVSSDNWKARYKSCYYKDKYINENCRLYDRKDIYKLQVPSGAICGSNFLHLAYILVYVTL